MGDCFVFVLQECNVCLTFRGGECQRGILSMYSGYSEKAHCTEEPPLHSINKGGGRRLRAGSEHRPAKNQSSIHRNYLKGGYRLLQATVPSASSASQVLKPANYEEKSTIEPQEIKHQRKEDSLTASPKALTDAETD